MYKFIYCRDYKHKYFKNKKKWTLISSQGFPGGTSGKESAWMQETQEMGVWSLGQEDLLE